MLTLIISLFAATIVAIVTVMSASGHGKDHDTNQDW